MLIKAFIFSSGKSHFIVINVFRTNISIWQIHWSAKNPAHFEFPVIMFFLFPNSIKFAFMYIFCLYGTKEQVIKHAILLQRKLPNNKKKNNLLIKIKLFQKFI